MEMGGIEPPTSCLQSRRSPTELHPLRGGGAAAADRPVTLPLLDAVGVLGFEPRTSALSELRSSQLSYTPVARHPHETKKARLTSPARSSPGCLVERHPVAIMA